MDNFLDKHGLSTLWGLIKSHVSSAISALSSVYAPMSHSHTKSQVTDLTAATTSSDGLMSKEDKSKLDGIDKSSLANKIEQVKVNGSALTPDTQKAVDIPVPTKTSELSNDSDFVSDSTYVHTDNNFSTAEKTKLVGVEAGAQVNVVEEIRVNGTKVTPSGKAVNITVPTDNASLANGAGYQTEAEVRSAIDAKLMSTFKPQGSVSFSGLPSTPGQGDLGKVWNVTDGFTIDSRFVEYEQSSAKSYPSGSNVVVVQVGSGYKLDVLGGFVDLTGYWSKAELAVITDAELEAICV